MQLSVLELVVPALIVANGVRIGLGWLNVPCGYRSVAANIAALATLVPFGSSTFGGFYLSIFGSPSAATIVLTAIYAMAFISAEFAGRRPTVPLLAMIVVVGLALYPATAGMTTLDPYDLGFRDGWVPILMALMALIGWRFTAADVAVWIGLAAGLFLIRTTGSHNIWDYLIDPFAMLAALALLAQRGVAWFTLRRRGGRIPAPAAHKPDA